MEAEVPTNTSTLLMLDEPRAIAIKDGKFTYTFHFRRIAQSDWEHYFNGIYVASRNEGGAQVNTSDMQNAGIELFESTLAKAEGYAREMTSKDAFWKIPPRHSLTVSRLLRNLSLSETEEDAPFDPEFIDVRLDALWSQPSAEAGATIFKGLVHRFSPPMAEQRKRFLRAAAISRIVGGARRGTTLYSTRSRVLFDLYDQLIQSVDGYGVAGRPLGAAEEIRREMDGYHKAESVALLFSALDAQPGEAVEAA